MGVEKEVKPRKRIHANYKEGDILKCIATNFSWYKRGQTYNVVLHPTKTGVMCVRAKDGILDELSVTSVKFQKVTEPLVIDTERLKLV